MTSIAAQADGNAYSYRRLMAVGFSPSPMIVDGDKAPISSMFSGTPKYDALKKLSARLSSSSATAYSSLGVEEPEPLTRIRRPGSDALSVIFVTSGVPAAAARALRNHIFEGNR